MTEELETRLEFAESQQTSDNVFVFPPSSHLFLGGGGTGGRGEEAGFPKISVLSRL